MTAKVGAGAAPRGGNLVALGISQLFRVGSSMVISVLLMRGLGVEGFGVYGYVMTVVNLAAFGMNLNMAPLINRELSRAPEETGRLVSTGLAATVGLSALTAGGIVAAVALLDGRPAVVASAGLAAFALALQSLAAVPEAAFHAGRRMALSARGQVAGRATLLVGTATLLWLKLGLYAVFVAQILDALVTLGILAAQYRRHLGAPVAWPGLGPVRALARDALPFGLNLLFGSVYLTVDVVLLSELRGDAEVGLYRGAVTLIAAFPLLANTLTTAIFPRMARHLGDPERAGEELRFASRMLLAVSVPAAVGGMLTAEPLMVFLGGPEFAASALPFLVMAPLLPLRFLNNGYSMTLSTLNRQNDRTKGVFFAAILNIAANLYAIPAWGALGAAATTLLTEVFLALWLRWRLRGLVVGLRLGETLLRVGLPSAAMAGALLLLPALHVLATIALGAAVYAIFGLASGAWRLNDLQRLRRV